MLRKKKKNKYIYAFPFLGAVAFGAFVYWGGISKEGENLNATNFAMQARPVPSFALESLENAKPLNASLFSTLKPKTWTLLNVWASWCPACKSEHDFLMQLAQENNVTLIGLNYRDKREAAKATLIATGDPYQTVIFDPKGSLALDLGSIVTPETYLINPEGILEFRYTGPLTQQVWDTYFVPRLFLHTKPSHTPTFGK